jgi:inner membrane protein
MAERSVKYEAFFIMLTFVTLWLFEVVVKRRVHSVQYLMGGAGMCLFYLLELSLAEHLGFTLAYALASAAVIGLITAYCIAVLKGLRRAAIVGGFLVALYGYLYILLKNQDFALLIGSIGLFLVLALVMYLTRKVDWNAAGG